MDEVTIDHVLEKISAHLHLSKETESELMAEIRTHLEEVASNASLNGENEHEALLIAAKNFGIDEVGVELQELHAERESVEAIFAIILPILFTLILRWLAFEPDGTARAWPHLLLTPEFWIIALAALVLPVVYFYRWRFVLIEWGIFWLLTVIFFVFPSVHQW
jgi:hypothetical protein